MHYYDENYLAHYGVIGMRWGVRRAGRLSVKAARARRATSKWDAKASAASAKGDTKAASKYAEKAAASKSDAKQYMDKSRAIQNKHIERSGGKKAYDYNVKQSGGKTVAKSLLLGTYGALRYNEARAKGGSRGEAAVAGILSGYGNSLTGGVLSIVEPRLRQSKYKNAATGAAKSVVRGTKDILKG